MLLTCANLFNPTDMEHRTFTKAPKVNLRDRLIVLAQAGDSEAVNLIVEPLRGEDGDTTGIVCIALDITERQTTKNE